MLLIIPLPSLDDTDIRRISSAAHENNNDNPLPVWTVLPSCLLYFFADPVQSKRGYEDSLCLFQLRARRTEVARAVPRLRGVEHLRRGGAREQEGRWFRGAGNEAEGWSRG